MAETDVQDFKLEVLNNDVQALKKGMAELLEFKHKAETFIKLIKKVVFGGLGLQAADVLGIIEAVKAGVGG